MMSRDKMKHHVRKQFLSRDKFILSCNITFMSQWRLRYTMTLKIDDYAKDGGSFCGTFFLVRYEGHIPKLVSNIASQSKHT